MQASTASAVAASASAIIGAVSAATAAFAAWNSRRSAQASQAALRESRQQRQIDNARKELGELGTVYDHAMALVESLAIELRRDPAAVERKREALRRCLLVSAVRTPALDHLVAADGPLTQAEIASVREELMTRSSGLHRLLTGADPERGT
jgi:hypothetical protein